MCSVRIFGGRALTLAASASMLLAAVPVRAQTDPQDSSARLLREGSSALGRGDLAGAEDAFRAAAQQAPQSAQAQMGLGLTLLREGHPDVAADALRRATALDSSLGGARLFLGIAEYQMGDSVGAARDLRAELAVVPDNVEALTWLTIVLLGSERGTQAVSAVDRAVELRPQDAQLLYFQAKAHEMAAKTALGKLYAMDPDSALVHRATAESLDGSGDITKSVQEYEAAVKKEPRNPDLLEALGDEQQKAGQVEAAAATYERSLGLNPNSAAALYSLGRLDVEKGKPAEGVKLLRRAQEAHAPASPTSFYLGLGLAELNQNEAAVAPLKASLTAEAPPFVQQGAWYQLSRVYARLGRREEQQYALAELKKVLDQQDLAKEATAREARAQSGTTQPTVHARHP